MKKEAESEVAISGDDVRAACAAILASGAFSCSPRMNRLLQYLVEQAISGDAQDTGEYAIGIKVFDRKPASYNTNDDPIVRVQVGRLRRKLKKYYADLGGDAELEIAIPIGSYMPLIRRRNTGHGDPEALPRFAIQPFKCISHHENGATFTHGLHDELVHQLFKEFGKVVVARQTDAHRVAGGERRAAPDPARIGVKHWLEGSIQIEEENMRTTVRLVDASAGCITWSEQFNRKISLAIAHQEELASSICNALKQFFAARNRA